MRDDDDHRPWNINDELRYWDRSWDDRSNHDFPDYDPDGELDRWLCRGIWVLMCFGVWKLLDLAVALFRFFILP